MRPLRASCESVPRSMYAVKESVVVMRRPISINGQTHLDQRWVPVLVSLDAVKDSHWLMRRTFTHIEHEDGEHRDQHATDRETPAMSSMPHCQTRQSTHLFSPPEMPLRKGPPTTVSAAS